MPAFNAPTPNDTGVPDMTGYSRGTGPNRTFEALFKGIGQTAADFATVKDKVTQGQIEDQARAGYDQVNSEFGLNPPSGMQDSLDQMDTLKAALSQGKISEVNYYGRLATVAKQLRSQYPGYENIVDQKIQAVTGTRPANAYRDAIFQALNTANSEAKSQQTFRQNYDKQFAGQLSILYGDDYFQNPQKYDFNKVQADVAHLQAREYAVDSAKKQLDLDAAQGSVNDKQVGKVMSQDFSFVTQAALSHATGTNLPSAVDTLNTFIAKGGGSAQETKTFIDNLSNIETNLRAQLYNRGQEYVRKGLTTTDVVNKNIDDAMYPITKAKEAVLGGDFKLAAQYAVLNKVQQDQQTSEMLKDPMFSAGAGLTTINKSLGDNYFTPLQGQAFDKANTIATELAGQAMAGNPEAIKKAIASGDDKIGTAAVSQSFKMMTDPKIPPEQFHNVFSQYFGKDALDFMSPKTVNQKDLDKIYFRFTSPDMTNAVFTKGTPQDQHDYIQWAITKATAIPAFRNTAGDVNSLLPDGASLVWDSKTHRIGLHLPEGYTGDSLNPLRAFEPPQMRSMPSAPVRAAISNFNQVLQNLDPIMAKTGSDADSTAAYLVRSLSMNLGGDNPDTTPSAKSTFWGSVYDAIKNANDKANEASKNDYFGENIPQQSSLIDKVGRAWDAMNAPARAAEQRPYGSYQVPPNDQSPKTQESFDFSDIDFTLKNPESLTSINGELPAKAQQMASGKFTGDFSEFKDAKTPLEVAEKFRGLNEVSDKDVISSFIKKATGMDVNPSTTAWCAAFVNAALGATGEGGTGRLNARSFLNYGSPTDTPSKGDIVVFSRGNSGWQGHVGFFLSDNGDTISVLGGNQGNKVSIRNFPKTKVLGYRVPPKIN